MYNNLNYKFVSNNNIYYLRMNRFKSKELFNYKLNNFFINKDDLHRISLIEIIGKLMNSKMKFQVDHLNHNFKRYKRLLSSSIDTSDFDFSESDLFELKRSQLRQSSRNSSYLNLFKSNSILSSNNLINDNKSYFKLVSPDSEFLLRYMDPVLKINFDLPISQSNFDFIDFDLFYKQQFKDKQFFELSKSKQIINLFDNKYKFVLSRISDLIFFNKLLDTKSTLKFNNINKFTTISYIFWPGFFRNRYIISDKIELMTHLNFFSKFNRKFQRYISRYLFMENTSDWYNVPDIIDYIFNDVA